MPLQISEFVDIGFDAAGRDVQCAAGAPLKVSAAAFTGAYSVGDNAQIVRFKGTGTVTWATSPTPEAFDGIEFRRLSPGTTFTVA